MIKRGFGKFSGGFFSLAIFILYSISAEAQEAKTVSKDSLVRVEMNDGNAFIGKIVEIDDEKIILDTEAVGKITLHRKYIKKIERVNSLNDGRKEGGNLYLHSTRYLFTSSAYGMEKGEAYYQNILVFYNQFNVGITDRLSVAAGIIPFFLLAGSPTPIWITPKYSLPIVKDKVNLSVGVMFGDVLFDDNGIGILPHLAISYGPREKNISFGVGYFIAEGQVVPYPVIDFSGIIRVSRKTFLMMENHLTSDGTFVAGIAILGAKSMLSNSALSYGLGLPFSTDYNEFIAIPWIGLTIPFGKKN